MSKDNLEDITTEDLLEDISIDDLFSDQDPSEEVHLPPPETGNTPPGAEGKATGLQPRDTYTDDGNAEVLFRGLAQGVTQGWADEVTGAVEAGVDVIRGKAGIPELGESYIKHRNESRAAYKEAELKSGGLYTIADMGGSIASMFTPWGAGVKLAATVLQGASAGMGYAEAEDPSEIMSLEDLLGSGAKGAALGVAGHGVGAVLGKAATGAKKLTAGTIAEALGVEGMWSKIRLGKMLRKQGRSLEEWSNNIYNMKGKDGKPLFEAGQSISETLEKTQSLRESIGQDIGGILNEADEIIGSTIKAKNVHASLMEEHVKPLLNSLDKKSVKMGNDLKDSLDFAFKKEALETTIEDGITKTTSRMEFIDDISLKELHTLKLAISKRHTTKEGVKIMEDAYAQNIASYERNIRDSLSGLIEDTMSNSKLVKTNPKIMKKFEKKNRDYGDLKEVVASLRKKSDEVNAGGIKQLFKNALQTRGLLAGAIASAGIGAGPAVALAVGINHFLSHPAAPATFAVGMKKISHWMTKHPEKYSPIAQKVLAGAATSHAVLDESLAYAHSYIDLDTNPMPRKTSEVISRKNELLTLMHGLGYEEETNALRKAIDTNDKTQIKILAETLGQDPKLSGFFKEGIGFDGQANTEQSKAAVNSWIQTLPTLKQRMLTGRQFQGSGQIPQEFYSGAPPAISQRNVHSKIKDKITNPRY